MLLEPPLEEYPLAPFETAMVRINHKTEKRNTLGHRTRLGAVCMQNQA